MDNTNNIVNHYANQCESGYFKNNSRSLDNRTVLLDKIYDHCKNIFVPDFIMQEIWEQEIFCSLKKLENMLTWLYEQFCNWYEN